MAGNEQRQEIEDWADRFGSGRLRQALEGEDLPVRLYLEERGQYELPGFEIDLDQSLEATPWEDPDKQARNALDSFVEYLELEGVAHEACDIVRREDAYSGGSPAIRVRGWEHGQTALGYIFDLNGNQLIDDGYPYEMPAKGDSPLRPTAYGSAYGLRHPAAQEALRSAAIVVVDQISDNGRYELEELLPPDARDLIDEELVRDFADTAYLIGWKLGQPRRHSLASLAEQIVGFQLYELTDVMLDQADGLSVAGAEQARSELSDFQDSLFDEIFLHEYLPAIDAYELADLVPAGVEDRRLSLWAPSYGGAGDPPPRATGSDEPEWSLGDPPGQTASEAVAENRAERNEEEQAKREKRTAQLAELPWRLELHGGSPHLLAEIPAGGILSILPPTALLGSEHVEAPWAWTLGRYKDQQAILDSDAEPEERERLDWAQFFEVFPASAHSLAVDAVFHTVEHAMAWVSSVAGHALAGGSVTPFERSATALEGVVAMREQLESCRAAGLVDDPRLTRQGIRHELFGEDAQMRFLAEARFAAPDGVSFDEVQGDFNQTIYDFSPLPVSLGIEPHNEHDGSVTVRCAMGVSSVIEAHDLANEVISQIRWRVGLQPIDLEEGEEADEVGFEIVDLDPPDDDADGLVEDEDE